MHPKDDSSMVSLDLVPNGSVPSSPARGLILRDIHPPLAPTVPREPNDSRPTRKRQRSGSRTETTATNDKQLGARRPKRLRGRRGSLQGLPEMPLDVLFEIFTLLGPLDLLHIARTTKLFRATLMTRSSRWIWRRAIASMEGFPECPSEMAEPEYVNLAFDSHCHFCLKGSSRIIVWTDQKRCCKTCFPNNYRRNISNLGLDALPVHLINILPSFERPFAGDSGRYFSLRSAQTYNNEYSQLSSELEKLQWIDKKLQESDLRKVHAHMCDAWFRKQQEQRSLLLYDARSRRFNAIVAKLTELGWGGRIENMYRLRRHKLVNQPKDLTEQIWSRIKDPIITFLWELRRPMVLRERRAILSDVLATYAATQHPHATIPNIADFLEMEKFRALIEDTPVEGGAVAALFEGSVTEFPVLIDNWRREKNKELVDLMKVECTNAVETMLLLATTFFRCAACESALEYPKILGHPCLTHWNRGTSVHVELGCTPWNYGGNMVYFHHGAFRAAKSILQACCVDPETATVEGLRLSNPLIECLTCTSLGQDRVLMRWSQAVHHVRSHPGLKDVLDQPGTFDLHDCVAAVVEVRDSPSPSKWATFEQERNFFVCVRCKRKASQVDMRTHLESRHAISEPVQTRDYRAMIWLQVIVSIAEAGP